MRNKCKYDVMRLLPCTYLAGTNKWDDAAKLLWLRVRLVGGAQTAYGRLPAEAKGSYAEFTKALKVRFEPEAHKERHLAQF